jgi:Glycosyl transferase family 90
MVLKTNKLAYYTRHFLMQLAPTRLYGKGLQRRMASVRKFDKALLQSRVDYYNKLQTIVPLGDQAPALQDLKIFKSPKAYNFDTFEFTRFFPQIFKAHFLFGDITYTEPVPTIQKSRPIAGDNSNAVLLKLDKARHYVFVKDKKSFASKKNLLIGRNAVKQEHRIRFMKMYFGHPLCDLGQVNKEGGNPKWLKPKIPIAAHLDYKFILSLEGNDVATNLKWIMSSNSIAVMTKPKYETWFMEGTLVPDHHYISIHDDFSDLEEKLNFYIKHEDAAQAIVTNANNYVHQFLNKEQEDLISLLVLQKYFYYTGQTNKYALL